MCKLLSTPEAAEFLGLSRQSLEKWRCLGEGPLFIKCGRRVKYRLSDLEVWLNSRACASTSEGFALDAPGRGLR